MQVNTEEHSVSLDIDWDQIVFILSLSLIASGLDPIPFNEHLESVANK